MIGVYRILNKQTEKSYIGSSIDVDVRLRKHFSLLRKNKHTNDYLQNAWNKYGEDSFVTDVMEVCSKNQLAEMEQHFISLFGDYNLQKDVLRHTQTEETKARHSATKKEQHRLGLLTKTGKPITQWNLEGQFIKEWKSVRDAARGIGVHVGGIEKCLSGQYKTGYGFMWKYKDDETPCDLDFTRKIINTNTRSNIVILTSDDGEVLTFDSIKLCCLHFGCTHANFSQYIQKKLRWKKKYTIGLVKSRELLGNLEVGNQHPSVTEM